MADDSGRRPSPYPRRSRPSQSGKSEPKPEEIGSGPGSSGPEDPDPTLPDTGSRTGATRRLFSRRSEPSADTQETARLGEPIGVSARRGGDGPGGSRPVSPAGPGGERPISPVSPAGPAGPGGRGPRGPGGPPTSGAGAGGGDDRPRRRIRYDASGLPITHQHIIPTDPEPSRRVAHYLFDSERFVVETRRHWIHIWHWAALLLLSPFALALIAGGVGAEGASFVGILVIAWIVGIGWVGWQLIDWWYDRFALTNKRVMLVEGLVTRRVAMMPLARVTDMVYTQDVVGRSMNYGTFVLESAGQDQALREIKHVPRPRQIYLQVVEEMYEPEVAARRRQRRRAGRDEDGS